MSKIQNLIFSQGQIFGCCFTSNTNTKEVMVDSDEKPEDNKAKESNNQNQQLTKLKRKGTVFPKGVKVEEDEENE